MLHMPLISKGPAARSIGPFPGHAMPAECQSGQRSVKPNLHDGSVCRLNRQKDRFKTFCPKT